MPGRAGVPRGGESPHLQTPDLSAPPEGDVRCIRTAHLPNFLIFPDCSSVPIKR